MRRLPKGIDPSSLPDLAHYRGHGIDRVTAWCLTPFCYHQGTLSFGGLAAHVQGLVAAAADERPSLARRPPQAAKPPPPDRVGKALNGKRADLGAVELVSEDTAYLIRDEDLAGRGGSGEARREIHRITGHGVLTVANTAGTAGDDLAAGDADVYADASADLREPLSRPRPSSPDMR